MDQEVIMFTFLSCCICFSASVIGAICGIGGGVIIKPVLDAFRIMDIAAINFLSGCTVFFMTSYSVIRSRQSGESHIETRTGFPLALGAALGGLLGKHLFSLVSSFFENKDQAGAVQASILLLVTAGTLLYTIYKELIRTLQISNAVSCILIGAALGTMSAFLGIGGGPINLVVLFYFFSMDTKTAAENSLYIIFFSQAASLIASAVTKSIPSFPVLMLVFMVLCGIGGGMLGRSVNQKLPAKHVDRLFIGLMVVIMLICIYNVCNYSVQ